MSFLLATLSGLLTALCFPKFDLFFLAWVCLIPLLFALLKKRPWPAFRIGFIGGFVYYGVLLYWIPYVPAHYGGLSPLLSILIYLVLVVFMALSWGAFAAVFSGIGLTFPRGALIAAPLIWISWEYVFTYLFTGFPWGLLGYSQVHNLPFLQTASVTGVYGLSFVLVFLQGFFVLSISARRKAPFFLALAVVLAVHAAGFLSLQKSFPAGEPFQVAVLQGNVSSDIYWDRISGEEIETLFSRHLELSRRASATGAGLIIWPEFSVPLCFSCEEPLYIYFKETLFRFVQTTGRTLLLGTNETTVEKGEHLYLNTALCLHPDLSMTQYHKMHLVPFGEYTPYKKLFFFVEKVTHAIGDVTPGKSQVLHSYEGIKFGSPICYEIIFPGLVRKFVKKGAHFLVTITNDGWYGESASPQQHFRIAVFRAVENRRFLLRAATTGISGIVDPYGRIQARSRLMTETYLTGRIRPIEKLSFYARHGDLLSYLSLTFTGIFFILALVKKADERK
ncbi:MAG TPA: apolipoprotein N-acyltransferase [Candidatus Desulfaltia sp.]|nr:apolipoprotein N-acyltransferase [Candidatus Desulfaltia sp.]